MFVFISLTIGCTNNVLSPLTKEYTQRDTVSTDSHSSFTIDTSTDTEDEPPSDSASDHLLDTDSFTQNAVFEPIGYATVAALDVDALTGGQSAKPPVVATTFEELQSAIDNKDTDPLTIHIEGTIEHPDGRVNIIGHRDMHIVGIGDSAKLLQVGIAMRDCANIIIRNLEIHHVKSGTKDAISISSSHHIWIDHNDIYNDRGEDATSYDGLLDITKGSDYITVSWNRFHDHIKGLIVGHSDDNQDQDVGTFHITYHHNLFSNISPGAVSLRFGQFHTFNNYFIFEQADSTIGISSRMGACVRIEHNRFEGIGEPIKTNQSGDTPENLGSVDVYSNDLGDYTSTAIEPTCQLDIDYPYTHSVCTTGYLPTLIESHGGVNKI